jgi:hypothetical protein
MKRYFKQNVENESMLNLVLVMALSQVEHKGNNVQIKMLGKEYSELHS